LIQHANILQPVTNSNPKPVVLILACALMTLFVENGLVQITKKIIAIMSTLSKLKKERIQDIFVYGMM